MHRRRDNGLLAPVAMMFMLWREVQEVLDRAGIRPLVTLALVGACCVIHFFSPELTLLLGGKISFEFGAVCVHTPSILMHHQWRRLLLAALVHLDDMHLYYNCVSLLWKGLKVESRYGSAQFALICVLLTLATHALMVAASLALFKYFGYSYAMNTCAAGISGLIFALKVLAYAEEPEGTRANIFGFQVSLRWAAWLELVLISLLSPNVSFLGHLCGIVAGLGFLFLKDKVKVNLNWAPRRRIVNGVLQ